MCVLESVSVCVVPLRAVKVWLQLWRAPDVTAAHPGRHCVALMSAGDSAGQGLSVNSGHHRARQSRIRAVCCRSCNAWLLRLRFNGKKDICKCHVINQEQQASQTDSIFWGQNAGLTQRSRRNIPVCCSRGSEMFQGLCLEASPLPASDSVHQQTSSSHPDVANSSHLPLAHTYWKKEGGCHVSFNSVFH